MCQQLQKIGRRKKMLEMHFYLPLIYIWVFALLFFFLLFVSAIFGEQGVQTRLKKMKLKCSSNRYYAINRQIRHAVSCE